MISSLFDKLCGALCSPEAVIVDRQSHSTCISTMPEDVISKHVMSYLKFREIVRLDSALANQNLSKYFHACLNGTVLCGAVDFRYLEWCRVRKCAARTLKVTSTLEQSAHFSFVSNFAELAVCYTAQVLDCALGRLLVEGKDFRTLNIQHFYSMRLRHVMPLSSALSLLEINACGNRYIPEDVLIVLVSRCPLLQVIDAKGCYDITKRLPRALAKYCFHLREVSLTTHGHFIDAEPNTPGTGYCDMFRSCHALQVVDCSSNFTITSLQTLADCCRALTTVKLQSRFYTPWDELHTALVDSALATLAQNNTNIHILKLSSFKRLDHIGLSAVARYLSNLHTFSLTYCQAELSGLTMIRNSCTKLRVFEVYDYRPNLPINNAIVYTYLQICILTTLCINCMTLSDAQFISLAQANPSLRALRIDTSHTLTGTVLTSNGISEACSYWPDLETFEMGIYYYPHFPIAEHSMKLQDSLLNSLVQRCTHLTTVCLSSPVHPSNNALSELSRLSQLRTLDLAECANLWDSGLTSIAKKCPLLEDINLAHCTRISSVGIDALADNCRELTVVTLQNCGIVCNSAIQNLIRHARHLQALDITQNPLLTFAAVADLPIYCFEMRKLRLYATQKPVILEFYESYRCHRRYFDMIFGWSEELWNNR